MRERVAGRTGSLRGPSAASRVPSAPTSREPPEPGRTGRSANPDVSERMSQMMIVMKEGATDEEVAAVVEKIERAGARAHRIEGARVTVIGAIGDVEQDASVASLGLEGQPGVDRVMPILKPYKLASSQMTHGERTVLDIGGRKIGGEHFALIAGPVHGRVARADARDRARRARRRRDAAARRRLQAAHLAVRLPGARPGGPAAARRGQGRDRAADRHRADGRARHRRRARGRRRDPDRRAQHAELPAAGRDRALRARRRCSSAACPRRSTSC